MIRREYPGGNCGEPPSPLKGELFDLQGKIKKIVCHSEQSEESIVQQVCRRRSFVPQDDKPEQGVPIIHL